MEIIGTIIVAIIAGVSSFAGTAITNSKHQAVMDTKIDNLTKQVEKHNSVIQRTYQLETDVAVIKERLREVGA